MSVSPHPSEALLSFVYGELSDHEAQRVQKHVEGCASCAATVESYRAVRRAAAALPREISTDAGLESLLLYGAQSAAQVRRTGAVRWVAPLLGAVAAVTLVFLVPPKQPPKTLRLPASAPPAVGTLAQNDVPATPVDKEKAASEEGAASLRLAPAASSSRLSAAKSAAKAKAPDEPQRARDELALAEHRAAAASTDEARVAPRPVSAFQAGSQPAAALATARSEASAGAPALAQPPTPHANAPGLAPVAGLRKATSASALAADAGPAGQRLRDEERRRALLVQLEHASGARRLSLLSELCALDVRLGPSEAAGRACSQVVAESPGTPEAAAAQRALDGLHTP